MGGIRYRGIGSSWDVADFGDKPLTIICHKGDIQVEATDQITLDTDVTRYHGERVVKIDPIAQAWIEFILGYELESFIQPSDRTVAQAHIIGLCDLPIKLMQKAGRPLPFFIKEPESFLHPSQQSCLADWATAMSNNVDENGRFYTLPTGTR